MTLVVPDFHVLRAAEGQLSEHLLLLVAEFLNLLGQLPVHEVRFALGNGSFVLSDVTKDLRAGRTIRREQFFDRPGRKVDARLSHNRVHNFAGALEVRSTGSVIAQASTADAVFVLLIALLAGFLVLLGQFCVPQR